MRFSPLFKALAVSAMAWSSFAVAANTDTLVMTANPGVDPGRYLGRWYEVARTPNRFQEKCAAATSEWTRQNSAQFDVVQTCRIGSPSGPARIWRGAGRVIDPASALIRIGFFGGFVHMDYRIMDHADDYSWCILTNGNPKFMWIMSKRPTIPVAQRSALVARARQLGFDLGQLIYDDQPRG
jgi:apolipoprotein D and lipocalin family protein